MDPAASWSTCLFVLLLLVGKSSGATFDVVSHGAKGDGRTDDSQAVGAAWRNACRSKNESRLVIGNGNYIVGPVKFHGPCKAPITVHVTGNVTAPGEVSKFKSQSNGWIIFQNIDRLRVLGGGTFDGQGAEAWSKNNCAQSERCDGLPTNLRFTNITNSRIQGITSTNSKLFHINILNSKNVTVEDVTISAPESSLNTDGIHVGRSTAIDIISLNITTGDDCVSLGDGSQEISIKKVTCSSGHGISIGSLGKYQNEQPVIGITVQNCTLANTKNGVRIKTWPSYSSGLASNVIFDDIIMNNVSNPVLIDQQYCPYNQCLPMVPSRVKISNVSFTNIQGTSATRVAMKFLCSTGIPCENVTVRDINLTYYGTGEECTSACYNANPQAYSKVVPPACGISVQSSSKLL